MACIVNWVRGEKRGGRKPGAMDDGDGGGIGSGGSGVGGGVRRSATSSWQFPNSCVMAAWNKTPPRGRPCVSWTSRSERVRQPPSGSQLVAISQEMTEHRADRAPPCASPSVYLSFYVRLSAPLTLSACPWSCLATFAASGSHFLL